MAKIANEIRHTQRGTEWVAVHVDCDAELAGLLRGSGAKGARHERLVHQLYLAAHPESGNSNRVKPGTDDAPPAGSTRTVRLLPGDAERVAGDLAVLLRQARAEGHPAAGRLADVAAQLGVTEPEPAPEPAPAL